MYHLTHLSHMPLPCAGNTIPGGYTWLPTVPAPHPTYHSVLAVWWPPVLRLRKYEGIISGIKQSGCWVMNILLLLRRSPGIQLSLLFCFSYLVILSINRSERWGYFKLSIVFTDQRGGAITSFTNQENWGDTTPYPTLNDEVLLMHI